MSLFIVTVNNTAVSLSPLSMTFGGDFMKPFYGGMNDIQKAVDT